MDKILAFFIENFPSFHAIVAGGPISLFWAFLCLYFPGLLKEKLKLKTGYTRKIFHFSIFTTVAIIQTVWGTSIVCLFGGMTTVVIFYAIFKGSGHILYEAIARESDAPHRSYFIIIPYFATLIGGITSNILLGNFAIFGYIITGFGDAVGEPVGTRFGKHKYRVPSFKGIKSTRSYEGSFAVFVVSLLAIILGIFLNPAVNFAYGSIIVVSLLALICALIEAISPHGWDNTIMQIIPSLLVKLFL